MHDLAVSKLVAGRAKDLEFLDVMLRHGMVQATTVRERLRLAPVEPARAALAEQRLARIDRDPETSRR